SFQNIASTVSLNVLVQLHNFFNSPDKTVLSHRLVHVKNTVGKNSTVIIENTLTGDYRKLVYIFEQAIVSRFDVNSIVYCTDVPEHDAVQLGNRSWSEGSQQISRGRRVNFDDSDIQKNFFRAFMYWQDGDTSGRVDLDLSMFLVSEDFETYDEIAYYNLRN